MEEFTRESFYHTKEVVRHFYEPFTEKEFINKLKHNKPTELYVGIWSGEKPIYELRNYSEHFVEIKMNYEAQPIFIEMAYKDIYKKLKRYFTPSEEGYIGSAISFRKHKWECYEIHTVQARMFGCGVQCKECKEKQNGNNNNKKI